jgi:predicted RNA-binding protein YlxR (DUF448 family)
MTQGANMSAGATPGKSKPKRGPRPKHVPQRMCVTCREHDAKRGLVRLVRTPEGRVEVDPTGKKNGRGAYLCRRRSCWHKAADSNALERALKVTLDAETRAMLREYANSHFPPDETTTT